MKPSNPINTMDVYASSSSYIEGPSSEQQAAGTVPLDTLPADWWNWLWRSVTERINAASSGMDSVYNEILSVLAAANIQPQNEQINQLLLAIQFLTRVLATTATPGAVKSSTDSGKVSVGTDGVMTPNGMGTPTALNTTNKQIVAAINEVLSTLNKYISDKDSAINGLESSKAPNNHASSATTYGTDSNTNYGHVKLSDAINSTLSTDGGVAATPAAVKAAYDLASGRAIVGNTVGAALAKNASAGSSSNAARADHVHPIPTLVTLNGTTPVKVNFTLSGSILNITTTNI